MPPKVVEKEVRVVSPVVRRFWAIAVLCIGFAIGYFVYATTIAEDSQYPFKLGLDLAGGSHLVYRADVSAIDPAEVDDAMNVLRDVIERRTNIFGVSEPIVQVEQSSFVAGEHEERLVVELPGVTNLDDAIKAIGETPLLEFKLVNREALAAQQAFEQLGGTATNTNALISNVSVNGSEAGDVYVDTGLTGRYLKRATLEFGASTGAGLANEPIVRIEFNEEGAELFAEITRNNIDEQLAIFLDGVSMSEPVIREAISGGTATISGNFTPEEARELVRNLNFGALPLPIELVSTQTIGASLGSEILGKGVMAGVWGLVIVIAFMILWYRLPGFIASLALLMYVVIILALFKLIPVTLTAAGLAAFILSIGMAVDANVLVFARMKEEFASGKDSIDSAREGFARAWSAIRDSNITSLLSAIVLFWFGTSVVKGFALVFAIGVVVSMLTAITVTRTLLLALPVITHESSAWARFLFGSGFIRDKKHTH